MRALILVGSGDAKSHSFSLGTAIATSLSRRDVTVEVINLVEYGLPLYNREIERNSAHDEATSEFLQKSEEADIIVWVTPNYHNSFSGILKNALDWQHARKFTGKILGLASNGERSPQPLDQLMLVGRSQGYTMIPTRVCTDASDYDEALKIKDESIKQRIERFTASLVDYSETFNAIDRTEKNF
ncbi:NAD(P)H-dependent oxidoreductase [Candidatus Saccharibacteria bacterium]|nr:NAD(P)H-dependent oxidoreductase [Candidatus Saccharibacteria bacterium]